MDGTIDIRFSIAPCEDILLRGQAVLAAGLKMDDAIVYSYICETDLLV